MNKHHESNGPTVDDQQQVVLRGPAELADALPYMLGFHPTDSIVLVALHGRRGRFGGRLRVGIPQSPREWLPVARHLAECLVEGSERRGARPDGIVVFLCRDPEEGESGRAVMERLRPLAQWLRTSCGALDVPVPEALCISGGRYWSYCCPDARCCPAEGTATALPGTSVMAAAAAYAGIRVRGSLREMESRLEPLGTPPMADQERALDSAGAALLPRILDGGSREQVASETLRLARRLMKRLGERATLDMDRSSADARDDRLISHAEAAAVILGLQDRDTRDRAAAWMEGPEAHRALRLWRALARRCVGPYVEHAAAPLSLAGWVSWSTGDEPSARVALSLALRVDPDYVFARLLHQACNDGLDPEDLRRCLRTQAAAPEPQRAGTPAPVPSAEAFPAGSAGPGSAAAGFTGSVPTTPGSVAERPVPESATAGSPSAAAPAAGPAGADLPGADSSGADHGSSASRAVTPDTEGDGVSRIPGPVRPPCQRTEQGRRPGVRPAPAHPGPRARPAVRKQDTAAGSAASGGTTAARRRAAPHADGDAAALDRTHPAGRSGDHGTGSGTGRGAGGGG
ncbi:DUF4192 domain-containing protein [Streptomyces spongiicola]|uniref:DUF4192 domain-containing protein n=1 Tax=Streptomyces spongiicola TaxID=1690221 RepID=A0ABM6VCN6_9ACTN|nr:DUF4192 domain-containing protein [Streptomyces spongiicola]AWK11546.1 DUF4192 domain-containing protein [Streptomyces spongiicola]